MKTLVLLSALAALATAATTPDYRNYRSAVNSFPISRREKKSPQHSEVAPTVDGLPLPGEDTIPEARTLGLKKKLIVPKKHGYHQKFRDSSEEKAEADPKEQCTKEAKLKFCEEEHAARSGEMKSAEDVDEPMSESDVKQSLQMAKEAVESIQKMAQKKAKSGNDVDLNEDIEIARKALDHIQQNFDKLESLNLRVATLTKKEALEGTQGIEMPKSDNERMAQWKGSSKKTQKSVDNAGIMEDGAKSPDHQSTVQDINSPKQLKSANLVMAQDQAPVQGKSNDLSPTPKDDALEDMTLAASEPKETKIEIQEKSSINDEPIKLVDEQTPEKDQQQNSKLVPTAVKSALPDDGLMMKKEAEPAEPKVLEPQQLKASEIKVDSVPVPAPTESTMKSVPEIKVVPEHENLPIKTEKSAAHDDMNEKAVFESIAKSTENKAKAVEEMPIMKSSENVDNVQAFKEAEISPKKDEKDINLIAKAAKEEMNQNLNNEHLKMKAAIPENDQQDDMTPEMKGAESVNVQLFEPTELKAQEISSPAMKAADPEPHHGFHGLGISDSQFHSHSHHHGVSNSHHHVGSHHHLSHLHHGHPIFKSMDMDGAHSMQKTMKEAAEKSALEQWSPHHKSALEQWSANHKQQGAARGAYGAYGAPSGAVNAVFPGAKNSPCAIPLLLSCSPNVVSGSLKSHSYGAPAYRGADGFNLHSKRDTKKTNEIPATTKVKRTHDKNLLKTSSTKIQL